jgi:oxygen-independent coproporphyrinogen-3 oxidase
VSSTAGVYVHVPFCLTRCGYCDFNAYAGLDELKPRYLRALEREAALVAPSWDGAEIASVFLGGGTPTTMRPEDLGSLLRTVRASFDVAVDAEITTEANPDTVDEAILAGLPATPGCRWARNRSTPRCSGRSSDCTRPRASGGRSSPRAPPATPT